MGEQHLHSCVTDYVTTTDRFGKEYEGAKAGIMDSGMVGASGGGDDARRRRSRRSRRSKRQSENNGTGVLHVHHPIASCHGNHISIKLSA